MKREPESEAFESVAGPLEQRLSAGLAKIALATRHQLFRTAAPHGLSPVQAQIQAALAEAPLTISQLASRLGLSAATISESVTALENKRLAKRTRLGRQVTVSATSRGEKLGNDLALWPDFLGEATAALSPDERIVLLRAVLSIVRSLIERGAVQESRMCPSCTYFRPNVHAGTDRPHHCALADLPFGDSALRLDCAEHSPAEPKFISANWKRFIKPASEETRP